MQIERDVSLAPFTTFGIGGPADLLIRAHSAAELVEAIRWGRDEGHPTFLLGLGANILVGDKGFRGLVIKNEARKFEIHDTLLIAESGCLIADLIEAAAAAGLSGLEHYQNIPSTVGGALWQNLHFLTYPHERTHFIAEITEGANVLSGDEIKAVDRDYLDFGYDTSSLHQTGDIILDATFRLEQAPHEEIELRRQKNAEWRDRVHPPRAVEISAGSIFRNIPGVGAGRLVDQAGLKGHRVGGAEVSTKHANYILNADHATAADVRSLISHIQAVVREKTGHALVPEITFVGEF